MTTFTVHDHGGTPVREIEGWDLVDACFNEWPEGHLVEVFHHVDRPSVAEIRDLVFNTLIWQVTTKMEELTV